MKRSASGLRWLLLLVMPSALGLLIFGMVGMMGQTQKLHDEVRGESLAAATAEARNLKRIVEDPQFMALLPSTHRYAVAADTIISPEFLGPLDPEALRAPARAFASPAVTACLLEASRREFEARDSDAALATCRAGLDFARDDEDRGLLLTRIAWTAQRAGHPDAAQQALVDFNALKEPAAADRLSTQLLRLISGDENFEPILRQLMLMPTDLALLYCDRVRDLDPALADDLEMLWRQRLQQRSRLALAQELLRSDLVSGGGRVAVADGHLLILEPRSAAKSTREIAIVTPELVLSRAGVEAKRFALGESAAPNSVPALPLIHAISSTSTDDSGATIGFTALLLAGLSVTFVTGLSLATRALHREALAARARTEFLTSVTHELKTPLASIRLIAEMLEMDLIPDEERRREYYSLLSGETARLSMLIENVLDLGRMKRGERAYDLREESLTDVVMSAVEVFRPVAQRDGLTMSTTIDCQAATATVDRGAIVQALLNILENSRKYATSGERIEIGGHLDAQTFILVLRDFGPGIPESELEAVFERFKRGVAQADGRIAGVGLGLHLSRRIVEDHQGRLSARQPRDDRGGVEFVMTIPLANSGGSKA